MRQASREDPVIKVKQAGRSVLRIFMSLILSRHSRIVPCKCHFDSDVGTCDAQASHTPRRARILVSYTLQKKSSINKICGFDEQSIIISSLMQ